MRIFFIFTAGASLIAQTVVAPTPEQPTSARGDNVGNYNLVQSFETGYRWAAVSGDRGMYRAGVNYGNGLRLLGGNLTVNSRDGHGWLFDEIVLNTAGLGNDPYQFAALRIQKNHLYRYDMAWRSSDYYNAGYVVSGAQHLMDTRRRMQDHELSLTALKPIQFRAGYTRNTESGPALSTEQGLNNNALSVLPLFRDVRRDWNEYRLGADIDLAGFKLTLLRQWSYYKDDSAFTGALNGIPAVAVNQIGATQYSHAEPVHGSNPGWLGNLNSSRRLWALNTRIAYMMGRNNFALGESGISLGRQGTLSSFQTVVGGRARRPFLTGDIALSVFPAPRLTLVVNQSVQSSRIEGDAAISQLSPAGQAAMVNFNYLGIRTLASSLDAQYRLTSRAGLLAAYQYSTRRIRTIERISPAGSQPAGSSVEDQYNHVNAGRMGAWIRPWQPFTIRMEGEVGRDNHPFLPFNNRNYHALNGRVEYRRRGLRLSTGYRQHYNVNSPALLTQHSSHARNYSANASWTVNQKLSFDGAYSKLHLDTAGSLAFFAGTGNRFALTRAYMSLYLSNVHALNAGARLAMIPRTTLYFGYNITSDAGDGRAAAVRAGVTDPVQTVFSAVQTFPLSYQAPLARLSIRLAPKLQWNAAWQLYHYRQEFNLLAYRPNYHAHTGYTSISWSF